MRYLYVNIFVVNLRFTPGGYRSRGGADCVPSQPLLRSSLLQKLHGRRPDFPREKERDICWLRSRLPSASGWQWAVAFRSRPTKARFSYRWISASMVPHPKPQDRTTSGGTRYSDSHASLPAAHLPSSPHPCGKNERWNPLFCSLGSTSHHTGTTLTRGRRGEGGAFACSCCGRELCWLLYAMQHTDSAGHW